MKKAIIAAVTGALLMCSLPLTTVNAEYDEPVIETDVEEYAYTNSITSSLVFNGSTAYCRSSVRGKNTVTRIEATQKLQKKVWWWWDDVQTWPDSVNGRELDMLNTTTVTESGTYRVRIEARVYSGNNYEDVYCNSTEVDYP